MTLEREATAQELLTTQTAIANLLDARKPHEDAIMLIMRAGDISTAYYAERLAWHRERSGVYRDLLAPLIAAEIKIRAALGLPAEGEVPHV